MRKNKFFSVLLLLVFIFSATLAPPMMQPVAQADTSKLWDGIDKVHNLYHNYMDADNKQAFDTAKAMSGNWDNNEWHEALTDLITPLFIAQVNQQKVNPTIIYDAIRDGLALYEAPAAQRTIIYDQYQATYEAELKKLLGNDITTDDLLQLMSEIESALLQTIDELLNNPSELESLIGASNNELQLLIIAKAKTNMKDTINTGKHSKLVAQFKSLGWDESILTGCVLKIISKADPSGAALLAVNYAYIRSKISLSGSDGSQIQTGVLTTASANPLDVKALINNQDITAIKNNSNNAAFVKWHSSNENVAKINTDGKIVAVGTGNATITLYRNGGGEPGTALPSPWLYKFELQAQLVPFDIVGTGSEQDPYQIWNEAHLYKMSDYINHRTSPFFEQGKHWKLMDNIIMSAASQSDVGWKPIGTNGVYSFQGKFNGNNKTIRGIKVDNSTETYLGLFGAVINGSIFNLGLIDCNVNGNSTVGGIVGYLSRNSSIKFCYVSGNVTGNNYVGGIAGHMNDSSIIESSFVSAAVSGNDTVGGIVGYLSANSSIDFCYVSGNVTGNNSGIGTHFYVGGIAGDVNNSNISTCYTSGDLTGNNSVTGMLHYVGGIAGRIYNNSNISNNVALGDKISASSVQGKICGIANSSTVVDCYAYENIGGKSNGPSHNDGVLITRAEINGIPVPPYTSVETVWSQSNANFDSNVWLIKAEQLPLLKDSRGMLLPGQDETLPAHLQ